jgi:hypothetical protein
VANMARDPGRGEQDEIKCRERASDLPGHGAGV